MERLERRPTLNEVQRLRDLWRRQRSERPLAASLSVFAAAGLAVATALIAAGAGLPAQLVGGLALVPLTWGASLWLIPAPPWPDDGGNGGGPGGGPRGDRPPSGGPAGEFDWEHFERDFWRHVDERHGLVNA
jgi:hypothetical protein